VADTSAPRLPTTCPHRPPCPGCPHYGERSIAPEAKQRLADLAQEAGLAEPVVHEGSPAGHRHRARLAVRGRARSPKIGIFQSGSHRIVDIPRCPVHHPLINRVAAGIKQAVRATGTSPYAERPHVGLLRYVQVVVERTSGTAQLVLVCNDDAPESAAPLAEAVRAELGDALHSLWWNGHTERSNTILGPHWKLMHGADAVRERILETDVFFPPGAFGQSNLPLADRLVERIASLAPEDARIVEFYSGCGAIGVPLLRHAGELHLNERGEHSLRGLELSLEARPAELRRRAKVHPGDAGAQPALYELLPSCDLAIVDPPRKGLEPALIDALTERPPAHLVYVSCGVDSFLEEARQLTESGALRLVSLESYALFPFTEHVETLAVFGRR
jgi:23S rRNA (uracil1939-C5)-methyltransferase